jgi:hypothetical protein
MTATCENCKFWLVSKKTVYGDGAEKVHFQAPSGKGKCDQLGIETSADFGCNRHFEDTWDHIEVEHRPGDGWQHWWVDKCPDCDGVGAGCRRCAGVGRVRHYGDGYIGEEQTRLHPKEKERMKFGPPKCVNCDKDLSFEWVSCPWCGFRTNKQSELEVVSGVFGSGGEVKGMVEASAERKSSAAQEVMNAIDSVSAQVLPPMPEAKE